MANNTKDYSEYFEPIMELPESGYCYLADDMFHVTRQNLIQEFLFENGYDWTRTTSDSKRKHEWNHGWTIVWRKIPANPSIGAPSGFTIGKQQKVNSDSNLIANSELEEYLDLAWSFDPIITWGEDKKEREVKQYLFEDIFAPKKEWQGFIHGLKFKI